MGHTVDFGKKIKDLTPIQEAVLMTLLLAEKIGNYPHEQDRRLFVCGMFFLHTLGVVFKSYHRGLMKQLEELGWIQITRRRGVIYYALTDSGAEIKEQHLASARKSAVFPIV